MTANAMHSSANGGQDCPNHCDARFNNISCTYSMPSEPTLRLTQVPLKSDESFRAAFNGVMASTYVAADKQN